MAPGITEKKKTYIKIGIGVVIALMIIPAAIRVILNHGPGGFPPGFTPEEQTTPVSVTEVSLGTIRDTLIYTGDIHALFEAEVYAVASGTVIRYHYDEGEYIRKGQVLVTLERRETWDVYMPLTVRAPISGIVARNYLDAGELATDSTPLSLIVAGDEMKAVIKVPEAEMGMIALGMQAELTIPSIKNHVFTGEVSEISPVLDTDTRTCRMAITFENDGMSIVAGMYGYVSIITEEKTDVVCVPANTVLFDEEGREDPYCFVVEDDTAHRRSLEVGIISNDLIEVLSGVDVGERIVVSGQEGLEDGGLVVIIE